jgi:hypothetical protein
MDWAAVGAIGEIAGAIGVIATLAYLIVQIKQNTASTEAATLRSLLSDVSQITDPLLDPKLNGIWLSGLKDVSSLSSEDRHQFTILLTKNFVHWVNVYHQARRGLVPEDFVTGYERDMISLMAYPSVQEVWSDIKYSFGDDYVDYLEKLVETHGHENLPRFHPD